jgi:hypothetical protein
MSRLVTSRIADLAETLGDLRFRLRQAARREVALAVGDALKELAHVWICGPVRAPYSGRMGSPWKDSWEEDDPWAEEPRAFRQEPTMPLQPPLPIPSRVPIALTAGLGAARWGLTRTQSIVPAVALGVVAVVVVYAGGPAVDTLVRLWMDGADLTSLSERSRVR